MAAAPAQTPKPERLSGTIETVDGHMLTAKPNKGAALKITLAPKVVVV